jgi:hypothetical protein
VLPNRSFRRAYILAGLSFWIRYEAITLFVSLLLIDVFRYKNIPKVFQKSIYGALLAALFIWISSKQNPTHGLLGNLYIKELLQFGHLVPQFTLITQLPRLLVSQYSESFIITFLVYCAIALGCLFFIIRKDAALKIISVFSLSFALFHCMFPFSPERYLYPILWCLYLLPLLCVHKTVYYIRSFRQSVFLALVATFVTITVLIVLGNFRQSRDYYEEGKFRIDGAYSRYYRLENILASQWINTRQFSAPVAVITYEPWIMDYFTTNPDVTFIYFPITTLQRCGSIFCLIKHSPIDLTNRVVLFIQQSQSILLSEDLAANDNFNVKIYNSFPAFDIENNFMLLARLTAYGTWANIYRFNPANGTSATRE